MRAPFRLWNTKGEDVVEFKSRRLLSTVEAHRPRGYSLVSRCTTNAEWSAPPADRGTAG